MAQVPNLIVLGHGVGDTLQLTVEAQRTLSRYGKAYALALPPNLTQYLKSLGVECLDLQDRFAPGRAFSEVYLDIVDFILRRTAEERPVIVLTPGNPLFLNVVSRFLIRQAGERKLSVEVYPGVSQVDTLINYLGLDVGTFGLQLFDARRLVERKQRINPGVPLLVLQLAGFAAQQAGPVEQGDPKAYQPLADHLGLSYPPEQSVTLLNTTGGQGRRAHAALPLSRFLELVPHIQFTSSLFVDAMRNGQAARSPQQSQQ